MRTLPGVLGLCALLAAALTGCSTPSINPLYTADGEPETFTDDRVVGLWSNHEPGDDRTIYEVHPRETDPARPGGPPATNRYTVTVRTGGERTTGADFTVRLVRLGGQTFIDAIPAESATKGLGEKFGLGVLPMHIIMPMDIGNDDLTVWPLHNDRLRTFLEASPKSTPHAVRDNVVILTGTTPEVQRFFRKFGRSNEILADEPVRLIRRKPADAAQTPDEAPPK